ncbi:hypothetical protein D3C74_239300 [compost metagenome]
MDRLRYPADYGNRFYVSKLYRFCSTIRPQGPSDILTLTPNISIGAYADSDETRDLKN